MEMALNDYLEQEAEGRRLFSEPMVETIPLRLGRTLEAGSDLTVAEDRHSHWNALQEWEENDKWELYEITLMPVTLEEAMRDFLIELAYLDFKDIYERVHALYPDTFRELSGDEIRHIATLYVDLILGFNELELDADGYAPFLALDEDALRALLELNGTPYVEDHGYAINAIAQMDLVILVALL